MIPSSFAVINKNKKILTESSSGGVFCALATEIISRFDGVVYGATIENGNVFHKRISKISEIVSLTKSKYVFSELKNTIIECGKDLFKERYVLFVGTPCQIEALVNYLNYKNINCSKLLTADLICHGAPDKKYWELYLREKGYDLKNINVNFRYKKPAWNDFSLKIDSTNRHDISSCKIDPYFHAFLNNYTLREACYSCKFKGENRKADVTLGDFWGCETFYPEYLNKNGVSLVIVRNKSDFVIDLIKKHCDIKPVDYFLSIKKNSAYSKSVSKPVDYSEKLESIEENGLIKTFKKKRYSSHFPGTKTFIKKILKFFIKKRSYIFNKKKTVGIVTDYGYKNFGNRLQNYALRMTLKEHGFKSVNLIDAHRYPNHSDILYYFNNMYREGRYQKRLAAVFRACVKCGEINFFYNYSKKHKKIIGKLHAIVLGSDQIWNVDYNQKNILFHLGNLGISKPPKVFSYASSFGRRDLPVSYNNMFLENLNKLCSISVREESGRDIVNNLGLSAKVHLDPTLLLAKEEWEDTFRYCLHRDVTYKYIFQYFLKYKGEYKLDDEYNKLVVIDILSEQCPYYLSNHFDFINFIKNAELVVTDSFHAVVFSYIFKKKVVLFERFGMSSRFESLFKMFGLDLKYNEVIDLSAANIRVIQDCVDESLKHLDENLKSN